MSYERRWSGRLSIRHDAVMNVQVLTLEGVLELGTMAEARSALRKALELGSPLVLDLRMLRSVDATGMSLLLSAARRAGGAQSRAALVPPHDVEVSRALSAHDVEQVVDVKRSLSAAIQAVAPPQAATDGRWTPKPSVPLS